MIGSTNRATMISAISQGLQPDRACSSRLSCWTVLVAADCSVLPAGVAAPFAVSFSSAAAAAVERGALSSGGAAVAAGGDGSVAFVEDAADFSAGFSAVAASLFGASFDSAGVDFAAASAFAGA